MRKTPLNASPINGIGVRAEQPDTETLIGESRKLHLVFESAKNVVRARQTSPASAGGSKG